ncbi:MAG: PAS domain S-box protein, partial [Pseudomonas sp.]
MAGSIDTAVEPAVDGVAEQAIEEAQTRYRLAVKATNDAIWDWDLKDNHVLWNDALERVYGHPLATIAMTGDWWMAQIHADDRQRIVTSIHDVIDGRLTGWSEEYRF